MYQHLKKYTVPVTISVSFYLFGFFIMVNALKLTDRDIAVGLIAGAVGGLTMLVATYWQERRSGMNMEPVSASSP